ncbi:Putative protein [Zobellia galactanivorans]|uniref:Uncharacterized protein n=1 Tax=Zobellia galactanivorans (strain DSM 12802 / CCUG 47099 / CIP 106680 / NCIMB 13871 / Dsij) TaxID=63186 RepID=G0L9H8_ZOBGA|nr:Putative protein [Zobellia galactanivorans]
MLGLRRAIRLFLSNLMVFALSFRVDFRFLAKK